MLEAYLLIGKRIVEEEEEEKHSAYNLALKILELYIEREKETPHKTNKRSRNRIKK